MSLTLKEPLDELPPSESTQRYPNHITTRILITSSPKTDQALIISLKSPMLHGPSKDSFDKPSIEPSIVSS